MTVIAAKQLPAPQDEDTFEALCLDVWRRLLNDPNAQRYGRRGQRQYGVDLFGRRDGSLDWVGVQCKVRQTGELRRQDIEADVNAAANMNPHLSEFVLATTVRRDTKLQDVARALTERNRLRGDFHVNTFFWDDFEAFLQHESNLDLLQKHYRDFVVRVLPIGTVLSKMLSLHVGVGRPDTLYEVVIGKTLPIGGDENPSFGLAYYKDLAFLMNLQTRRVALFRVPLRHFAELEGAIESRQDQRILSRWLNEIGGIDRVLELAEEDQTIAVSPEQMRAMEAFDWRP